MIRRTLLTAMVCLSVLVAGCSQDDGSSSRAPSRSPAATPTGDRATCDRVTEDLLGSVQAYVDAYGVTLSRTARRSTSQPGDASDTDLRDALQTAQRRLRSAGCNLTRFRRDFKGGLQRITARGPLARAVLLRLTASMTGTLQTTPTTVTVRPRQDLAQALAGLAPGSTARLLRGSYALRRPLVLLAGITLTGRGRGRTTISSTAPGSAVLVLTDGRVDLRNLTLRHRGARPASVLVGGPSSSVVLTSVRVTGGQAGRARDQSGSGVTMTAQAATSKARGTTLEVTRSDISGNAAAGILLTGAHRASIRSTRFAANRQCGVCFAATSGGAVRNSTFADNGVGVAVLDEAGPLLAGNTFTGGEIAVQVLGRAAPAIQRSRIDGPSRAAMIFGDSASGRVSGSRCTAVPYGIVVGGKSLPYLGRNACPVVSGR